MAESKVVLITDHIVTDHTNFGSGMHFPVMDAIAHLVDQLNEQGFRYKQDYFVHALDMNSNGQRVIQLEWYTERQAMIVKLSGVKTVYGEMK